MDKSAFHAEFVSSAHTLIKEAESWLVELMVSPTNTEAIKGLFRAFHTLKGNAGFVGESEIRTSCHEIESLLSEVRNGKQSVTPALLDLLSQSVNSLAYALNSESSNGLVDRIAQLIATFSAQSSTQTLAFKAQGEWVIDHALAVLRAFSQIKARILGILEGDVSVVTADTWISYGLAAIDLTESVPNYAVGLRKAARNHEIIIDLLRQASDLTRQEMEYILEYQYFSIRDELNASLPLVDLFPVVHPDSFSQAELDSTAAGHVCDLSGIETENEIDAAIQHAVGQNEGPIVAFYPPLDEQTHRLVHEKLGDNTKVVLCDSVLDCAIQISLFRKIA